MKKIDYMKSSLDFCLYPNEVLQRFAGKEVIVYGTGYESYNFFQMFAQHLKIKHIINHFNVDDFLKNGNIRDLDELLFTRTTEPIFVLSRNFWVEIVDYMERNGLVLGSDFFFLEQGQPMIKMISDFIEHNQKLWKSEAILSKNKILIPFNSKRQHDAPYNVSLAYCGNYLAKRYNAEIFYYIRYGKERELMGFSKSARDVARSHNVSGLLDFECNQEQLVKAKNLFDDIWSLIDTWQDVKQIYIENINFGISIIRDYLRWYVPSVNPRSKSFAKYLWFIVQRIVFLFDYFKNHNDIKAVILQDGVCRESFLRDIAIAHGVPVYAICYFDHSIKCTNQVYHPNGEHFKHYKEFSSSCLLKSKRLA